MSKITTNQQELLSTNNVSNSALPASKGIRLSSGSKNEHTYSFPRAFFAALTLALLLLTATPSNADNFSMYWSTGSSGSPGGHHMRRPVPPHDMNRWRSGHWVRGHRGGHSGSWWVIGDSWYLYPEQAGPYPDIYVRPVTVLQAAPAQAVVVEEPVIIQSYNPTPSGAEVRFNSAPTPTIDATQTSPTYRDEQGRTCREYKTTAITNGHPQQIYGAACLSPDGTWRVVR